MSRCLTAIFSCWLLAMAAESAWSVPVQFLIPGFSARQLSIDVNNINSLASAPDGRIFALGYDGNVWRIQLGTNGATDKAELFFKNDHNDIPPSIGMGWAPGGLYIASHGRIIRLRDSGQGRGTLETVAQGWRDPAAGTPSALDTFGVAVSQQGEIFFGLGAESWNNPYLTNGSGGSAYNVKSDRGTIQKISADWQHRSTVCTGIRYSVALAFNALGDLFCTDQEGATWLPNGNPLDELDFIQPGRHYGFPPRHPRYLSNVIDEPSVFDYAPQHESTCGLHFDNPVGGGTNIFGPVWWRDNAIVAGESRGKIWRTALVKTVDGYVAQNNLIACLDMLTIDAMPTARGSLLVCCHSGKPDWGSGPEGKGKLFEISYSDASAPQPIFASALSPTEIEIAFDRSLSPADFAHLAERTKINQGKYVTAGERFESFVPGYEAVQRQKAAPHSVLQVLSAGFTADGNSILLRTPPRLEAVNYAITLPYGNSNAIDVLSDLTGVIAEWRDAAGALRWSGWLPHLDLQVSELFDQASAPQRHLFELIRQPGRLTLKTQLDLWSMLHPAVQPGSRLDFTYPPETVTVDFSGSDDLQISSDTPVVRIDAHQSRLTVIGQTNRFTPVSISLSTGGAVKFHVSWHTDEDSRSRAFPLRRFFMPWAVTSKTETSAAQLRQIPEIAGGDWRRGRALFYGPQPACYRCHAVGGEGGKIGPDLSNLTARDYASVMKDIMEPSAAINPDYVASIFTLKNGEVETGLVQRQTTETIFLAQANGGNHALARSEISSVKPSRISLMPEGLLTGLSDRQRADLMTFLLTSAPLVK